MDVLLPASRKTLQAAGLAAAEDAAPWQKQHLQELALLGPGAMIEVSVGRQPVAEPRLLAALRVLTATAASDVRGRSTDGLGRWEAPLVAKLEVPLPGPASHPSYCQHKIPCITTGCGGAAICGHSHLCLALQVSAMRSLARIVALILSSFPTAIEEDEAALAAATATDLRSAIAFRLDKKRSLCDALRTIAARVKARSDLTWRLVCALYCNPALLTVRTDAGASAGQPCGHECPEACQEE